MAAPLFAFSDVTVPAPARAAGDGAQRDRLAGLTAEIAAEGVTAVDGPSGAGKSTLLRLCNVLEVPARGAVAYRGAPLRERDVLAHRREVAMVFQAPVAFPGTVADNLRVAAPGASDDTVTALLERAALPATFATRRADELSGGEQQRMCLARALATSPRVLLADEPTSALDADAALLLERLIAGLAASGVPVVLVTHDAAQRGRLADHVLRLVDGRLAA